MADPRLDRLRAVPLFAGCSDQEMRFIASHVEDVDIESGKTLCRKGESGGDFFVILEGKAEVDTGTTKKTLGPGDFFGEIALIDDGPRTATVRSVTAMRSLVLSHDQFRDVLRQNADITVKVLRAVTERLRDATALPSG